MKSIIFAIPVGFAPTAPPRGSPTQSPVSPAKLGDDLLSFLGIVARLCNILDSLVECGLQILAIAAEASSHCRLCSSSALKLIAFATRAGSLISSLDWKSGGTLELLMRFRSGSRQAAV